VGHDCSIPTCKPSCVHGKCVAADQCECYDGWSGDLCNIGKKYSALCYNCINGTCKRPDECECIDGWEGDNCNIATSVPPCVNGYAVLPNVCYCEDRYTGRICDVRK
jgi:hypothetical protein